MSVCTPRNDVELREVLAVILDQPGNTAGQLDEQVDTLLRYARARELSLEHCLADRHKNEIRAACLCVDSPGRVATVFVPSMQRYLKPPRTTANLLAEAIVRARARNIQMLQAMVGPEAAFMARVYREAGFNRLAELIYLESDVDQVDPTDGNPPEVQWVIYGDANHRLFAEVVQGTYLDSLDCIALNGVRHIDDILASHRAAGEWQPDYWMLGLIDGEPFGVLLTSVMRPGWSFEVVYMGVLPRWRAKGLGSTLLRRAFERVRNEAASLLTLTVDRNNAPARRLYQRFGFHETGRRVAWLKLT